MARLLVMVVVVRGVVAEEEVEVEVVVSRSVGRAGERTGWFVESRANCHGTEDVVAVREEHGFWLINYNKKCIINFTHSIARSRAAQGGTQARIYAFHSIPFHSIQFQSIAQQIVN